MGTRVIISLSRIHTVINAGHVLSLKVFTIDIVRGALASWPCFGRGSGNTYFLGAETGGSSNFLRKVIGPSSVLNLEEG